MGRSVDFEDEVSRPEPWLAEDDEIGNDIPDLPLVVRVLAGHGLGPYFRFVPWCILYLVGWAAIAVTLIRISSDWTSVLRESVGILAAHRLVQGHYGFEVARGKPFGCGDEAHNSESACEKDDYCRWSSQQSRCLWKTSCESTSSKSRSSPMVTDGDGEPVWVTFLYEAVDGGNIMEDKFQTRIRKFEKYALNDNIGAKMDGTTSSPWTDWCLLNYASESSSDSRCAPVSSLASLFAMTSDGLSVVQSLLTGGWEQSILSSCFCSSDAGVCSFCNSNNSVSSILLALLRSGTLTSDSSSDEASMANCILQQIQNTGVSTWRRLEEDARTKSAALDVRRPHRSLSVQSAFDDALEELEAGGRSLALEVSENYELSFFVRPHSVAADDQVNNLIMLEYTETNPNEESLAISFVEGTTKLSVSVRTRTTMGSCTGDANLAIGDIAKVTVVVRKSDLLVFLDGEDYCSDRGTLVNKFSAQTGLLQASAPDVAAANASLGDLLFVQSLLESEDGRWKELSQSQRLQVAVSPGSVVGDLHGTFDVEIEECQRLCEAHNGCHSVSLCRPDKKATCFLFDAIFTGTEETESHDYCTTYWLNTTEAEETSTGEASNSCDAVSTEPNFTTYAGLEAYLTDICEKSSSCQYRAPFTSDICASTGFYHPTSMYYSVTGDEKAAVLASFCDEGETEIGLQRREVLPRNFDCSSHTTSFAKTTFFAGSEEPGGSTDPVEYNDFLRRYMTSAEGFYEQARATADAAEDYTDGIKITILTRNILEKMKREAVSSEIGLLVGALVLAFVYAWWVLESFFLGLCASFAVMASAALSISLWGLLGTRLSLAHLLVLMLVPCKNCLTIAGLNECWRSLFDLYEDEQYWHWTVRLHLTVSKCFRYTLAASGGSIICLFMLALAASFPNTVGFCVFAIFLMFWDIVFVFPFSVASIILNERTFEALRYGVNYSCIDANPLAHLPDVFLLPRGCCIGQARRCWQSLWRRCCGRFVGDSDRSAGESGRAEPRRTAWDRGLAKYWLPFAAKWKWGLLGFWAVVFIFVCFFAGFAFEVASQPDARHLRGDSTLRAAAVLEQYFLHAPVEAPEPRVTFAFGLASKSPIDSGKSTIEDGDIVLLYDSDEASTVSTKAGQLELLELCRAPDSGSEGNRRCRSSTCLVEGASQASSCSRHERLWREHGIHITKDVACATGRYCFMEDFVEFWASSQGGCAEQTEASCSSTAASDYCLWDATLGVCYARTGTDSYAGLEQEDFLTLLAGEEFEAYRMKKQSLLRELGRQYEADRAANFTGFKVDSLGQISLAWVTFNATYEPVSTAESAQDWYDRWEQFRESFAPSLGGLHTSKLYLYLAEADTVSSSVGATIGVFIGLVGLAHAICAWNWKLALIGWVCNTAMAVTHLAFIFICGWQMDQWEASFLALGMWVNFAYVATLLSVFRWPCRPRDCIAVEERISCAMRTHGSVLVDATLMVVVAGFLLFFSNFEAPARAAIASVYIVAASLITTLSLLVPLLYLVGPEGTSGDICSLHSYLFGQEQIVVGPPADIEQGLTVQHQDCGSAVFAVYDEDGDKKLDKEQLQKALHELHSSAAESAKSQDEIRQDVSHAMEHAVFDDLGLVDYEEFLRIYELLSAPHANPEADGLQLSDEASMTTAVNLQNLDRGIAKGRKTSKSKQKQGAAPKKLAVTPKKKAKPSKKSAKGAAQLEDQGPLDDQEDHAAEAEFGRIDLPADSDLLGDSPMQATRRPSKSKRAGVFEKVPKLKGRKASQQRYEEDVPQIVGPTIFGLPQGPLMGSFMPPVPGRRRSAGTPASSSTIYHPPAHAGDDDGFSPNWRDGGPTQEEIWEAQDLLQQVLCGDPTAQDIEFALANARCMGVPEEYLSQAEQHLQLLTVREEDESVISPNASTRPVVSFHDPEDSTPMGAYLSIDDDDDRRHQRHQQHQHQQQLQEHGEDDVQLQQRPQHSEPEMQLGEDDEGDRQQEEALRRAEEEQRRRAAEEALLEAQRVEEERRKAEEEQRLLSEAEAKKQQAQQALSAAIAARSVEALKEAIDRAKDSEVDPSLLAQAEEVLDVEEQKDAARKTLEAARSCQSPDDLSAAIATARAAGLGEQEPLVIEFEKLLAFSQRRAEAQKALESAIESRSIEAIESALPEAEEVSIDPAIIAQAKQVLEEEKPKVIARAKLAEICAPDATRNKETLREALELARSVGLEEAEMAACAELLRIEEEKERLFAEVKACLEASKGCTMTEIDSVRGAKDALSAAISAALAAGVPEADLMDAELRRKKLHNTVEDLKGSIRVFCRIRPLSGKEKDQGDDDITKQLDPMTLQVAKEDAVDVFAFDAVFTPGTQDEIFEDCRDLVQSAVDGYNVTLFAYGQTGAGKTFTMAGVPGMLGVSPRTITEVFEVIEKTKSRFDYVVTGSMLELYQQTLVDLLAKGEESKIKKKALNVRQEKSGSVVVENLTEDVCNSAEDLSNVMERGNAQRSVAATAMNSESSRSHLVLIIRIQSVNKETKQKLEGKILIVDLAGSERLKKSQTTAEMQKESIEINKSLTALGDVIEALTRNQKQVPYRNHKLTQLMQDSIGGSAKTLMFVNCSPAASNWEETVNSLKYAARAKKITNNIKVQG